MAEHTLLNTTFPVLLPDTPELRLSEAKFGAYIANLLHPKTHEATIAIRAKPAAVSDATTKETAKVPVAQDTTVPESAFMAALLANTSAVPLLDKQDGKMLTENGDVAFRTTGSALLDLFYELEDVISADRMRNTLEEAWKDDSDATLKIIWNARSIHLGKSSRNTFYRAVGWLTENHPASLLGNLPWLVRPLIEKKVPKEDDKKDVKDLKESAAQKTENHDDDSDFEMIDGAEADDGEPDRKRQKVEDNASLSQFDVKFGLAHGYWKDLLNILALAVNDELKVDGDVRSVFNVEKPTGKKSKRDWTQGRKKQRQEARHEKVIEKLAKDPFYKALHLTVARLFAEQLKLDTQRLNSGNKSDIKNITLAGKWAPSHKSMHDQHTCIVSSIAELLYPFEDVCPSSVDPADRTLYLKYARQAYQSKTLSPLRSNLQVVERSIAAEKFEDIKYDRIPSLAMKQYTGLFIRKDYDGFDKYIEQVAEGKARISGATLMPSKLIAEVSTRYRYGSSGTSGDRNALVEKKIKSIQSKSLDGQWKALVQRIRDSGKLESSIAVCDVSGSMSSPVFHDGTCPMDSAIGLSLLLAEVVEAPFGGAFITFSERPEVLKVGGASDSRTLHEKVQYMERSDWGGSTDFMAVFEKLVLPMAIENKVKQEDMVKQVFVFSDMHFNMANGYGKEDRWTTSYERIEKLYKQAGYDMPKLIFWNLAGGRAGYDGGGYGDDTAPKPVEGDKKGTALVSGYSQAQLKTFLSGGQFDEAEEEAKAESEEDEVKDKTMEEEGDGDVVVVEKTTAKDKTNDASDPLAMMRRAIGHPAYRMLKVVD